MRARLVRALTLVVLALALGPVPALIAAGVL